MKGFYTVSSKRTKTRRKKKTSLKKRPRARASRKVRNKKVYKVLATRKLSRPRKLTDKLIKECCELILEGLPIDRTCDYLGISTASYYNWKDKGERYLNQLHDSKGPQYREDEDCAVFVQAVVRAKATWQLEILRRSFGDQNKATWIRDMTMMERRDRPNWGRNESLIAVTSAPLPDDSYL